MKERGSSEGKMGQDGGQRNESESESSSGGTRFSPDRVSSTRAPGASPVYTFSVKKTCLRPEDLFRNFWGPPCRQELCAGGLRHPPFAD